MKKTRNPAPKQARGTPAKRRTVSDADLRQAAGGAKKPREEISFSFSKIKVQY